MIGAVILVIVATTVTLILQGQSSSPVPVPGYASGKWALKFDDEFTGPGLDTSKWSTGWYGSGVTAPVSDQEDDCYDPAQVSQGGGALSLALTRKSQDCGNGDARYAAGLVSTQGKFSFTYGLAEARVWLPAVTGKPGAVANWPAVWADGKTWPQDGEIDIAEAIGGRLCGHLHNAASPGGIGAGGGTGCPAGIVHRWLAHLRRELGAGEHHLLLRRPRCRERDLRGDDRADVPDPGLCDWGRWGGRPRRPPR